MDRYVCPFAVRCSVRTGGESIMGAPADTSGNEVARTTASGRHWYALLIRQWKLDESTTGGEGWSRRGGQWERHFLTGEPPSGPGVSRGEHVGLRHQLCGEVTSRSGRIGSQQYGGWRWQAISHQASDTGGEVATGQMRVTAMRIRVGPPARRGGYQSVGPALACQSGTHTAVSFPTRVHPWPPIHFHLPSFHTPAVQYTWTVRWEDLRKRSYLCSYILYYSIHRRRAAHFLNRRKL